MLVVSIRIHKTSFRDKSTIFNFFLFCRHFSRCVFIKQATKFGTRFNYRTSCYINQHKDLFEVGVLAVGLIGIKRLILLQEQHSYSLNHKYTYV